MPTSKPQNSQKETRTTEAMDKSVDGQAGQKQSSHNNKSHAKAGSSTGAGGGKKQERHH